MSYARFELLAHGIIDDVAMIEREVDIFPIRDERCVDRIINVFPAKRQDQVRTMLADCLRLVVSQQLVRKADHSGRIAAAEVLVTTHAVSSMIRQGNTHKIASAIQAGSRVGMQSLDAVLMDLVRKGVITGEEAFENALDPAQFERYNVGGAIAA